MSNSVEIFVYNTKAGLLERSDDGEYIFSYDKEFLNSSTEAISLSLPLREEPYVSEVLHPFFDGLIPEGWLLDLAVRNWKLKHTDRFELLRVTCKDAVGAVSVREKRVAAAVESDSRAESVINSTILDRDNCPVTNTKLCMISYSPLDNSEMEMHELYRTANSKRMFGSGVKPKCVGFSSKSLKKLALAQVDSGVNLTGVQKKMSIGLVGGKDNEGEKRLTYIEEGGEYILKPQSEDFELLPETEHLCMKLAEVCKFKVPSCALIPLESGEISYLIKRFDRKKSKKLYQEDFCQISGKPTSEKYRSSVEKCAKIIETHCTHPKVNLVLFFDIVLFNYIIGNADMHLKNYSLVKNPKSGHIELSPSYDYVSTKLLMPEDTEETALTINGKKSKITVRDWKSLAASMGFDEGHFQSRVKQFKKWEDKFYDVVEKSFISRDQKNRFKEIIQNNMERIVAL